MPTTVQDVMSTQLVTCPPDATLADAAKMMRDRDIGDVLVVDGSRLEGIVTDRDIVVRCIAEGADGGTQLHRALSGNPTCVPPDCTIEEAAQTMRKEAIRRLPVVQDGKPVGIVSLGDLAVESEPQSPLADISTEPPNN